MDSRRTIVLQFCPEKGQFPKGFCKFARVGMESHWDDLRIFLAVARAESLSGGGRR